MKVLFVVPYVPSLIRVRPFHLIRHLAARGHHVTVATVWTNTREQRELEDLSHLCSEVVAVPLPRWRSLVNCGLALGTNEPLQSRYSWSSDLASRIREARDGVDLVHIEHLRGAQYGMDPRSGLTASVPIVWDSVDCISDLFEQAVRNRQDRIGRWINRIELSRTQAYEARAVSRFDRVLVTSPHDKASLQRLASGGHAAAPSSPGRPAQATADDTITVLPNGVDFDDAASAPVDRAPNSVVFSGKLSYHANVAAVRHLLTAVMPRVWARRPDVKLWLVGKDPSSDVLGLASHWTDKVVITGTVPSIRPFLRQASVSVAPLVYGVGCQNKVLEAMACETPVVATPRAVGALAATPGRDVIVADGAQPFADAVLELLESPLRQREVGRAGRAYVETHHRWERIAARLESIYVDVLAARRGPRLERAAG